MAMHQTTFADAKFKILFAVDASEATDKAFHCTLFEFRIALISIEYFVNLPTGARYISTKLFRWQNSGKSDQDIPGV